jgi:maleylpyruvate isomerase
MRLHGYFRSTTSWRVRIALSVKGVRAEHVFHHLRQGAQHSPGYVRLNPQALLPTLETDDDRILTQSLAICEWLDESVPEPPLLPGDALRRAWIRAFALAIACDIHPVQNLKVLARLRALSLPESEVTGWAAWIIRDGLLVCERLLQRQEGPFCFGPTPTLADICLVPQL